MSVPIKVDLLPKSRRPDGGVAMVPLWITIHDTGNTDKGADAKAHSKWLQTEAPDPSWHFTVDDKEIYQHLPTNIVGWHAGDGRKGPGNSQSIGIEICMNKGGNRAKAEANAAWLAAKLVQEVSSLRPFPECLKQHYDWSGKNCPQIIRGRKNGWQEFLAAVEANLFPVVLKTVGVHIKGKDTGLVGYYSKRGTLLLPAVLKKMDIEATGHGSYINLVPPETADPALVKSLQAKIASYEAEIKSYKNELASYKSKIDSIRKLVN